MSAPEGQQGAKWIWTGRSECVGRSGTSGEEEESGDPPFTALIRCDVLIICERRTETELLIYSVSCLIGCSKNNPVAVASCPLIVFFSRSPKMYFPLGVKPKKHFAKVKVKQA